jgi:hypothetical protein
VTSTLALGYVPQNLTVVVSRGADFYSSMRRGDGAPWAADLTLTLDFGAVQWAATLAGPVATWQATAAQVQAMLDSNPAEVRLWHTSGDRTVLWARGQVSAR